MVHENRLEGKELDELAELEDEEDEDFLAGYRQKRMNEIASLKSASIYNQVYPLQKPDYSKEVTEASKAAFVFVLLTSSAGMNTESRLLVEIWRELATKFGDVKFCQMQANLCIEGYPERNCPTILVYKDGDIKRQIVTLKELSGDKTTIADLEHILRTVGAVKQKDARFRDRDAEEPAEVHSGIRQSAKKSGDDSDSDWD